MKVTKEDIRNIKVGTSVTFTVPHPRDIDSASVMAYQIGLREPERKTKYSCKSNFAKRQITITAISVK